MPATMETRVYKLAIEGLTPAEIETALNIPRFTIHTRFHASLMAGYSRGSAYFAKKKPVAKKSLTKEERAIRNREYVRTYYWRHREEMIARQQEGRLADPERFRKYVRDSKMRAKTKRQGAGIVY